jgi:carbamoyl-phosphate synthase small subunit
MKSRRSSNGCDVGLLFGELPVAGCPAGFAERVAAGPHPANLAQHAAANNAVEIDCQPFRSTDRSPAERRSAARRFAAPAVSPIDYRRARSDARVRRRPGLICKLALEDGAVFTGASFGAAGTKTGEVVFNTSHTGYQEILTDPSYCGQIVTMTFPLIGNYGVNTEDFESVRPHLSGFVVKELPRRPSNYRASASLAEFLARFGVIGLSGVDTRALTRRTRIHGALRGAISTEILDDMELIKLARSAEMMEGANLVQLVTPDRATPWTEPLWTPAPTGAAAPRNKAAAHVVALDCGIKHNILRHLVAGGCRVTAAPAGATAGQICELVPDALLVGNGPGDPAAVVDTIETLRALIGQYPIFGICLGHQMLALALQAETYKLRFGHHGANVPVMNFAAERVEITSQNHGFAVDIESLKRVGGIVTHVNLNDGSLEGFMHPDAQLVAVQFHPEASPGPHDAGYLFRRFAGYLRERRALDLELLQK